MNRFVWGSLLQLGSPAGTCYISEKYRLTYLNIPKVASSSLKEALVPIGFSRSEFFVKPEGWTTFAFLRDPFDRLVSGVLEIARRRDEHVGDTAHEFARALNDSRHTLQYVDEQMEDAHLQPQHDFLVPWNPVDHFYRFEDVELLPLALNALGVEEKCVVPRENVSEPSVKDLVRSVLEPLHAEIEWLYMVDYALRKQYCLEDEE